MEKVFRNTKLEDLEQISFYVYENIKDFFIQNDRSCIIFLEGDLGAGKTTFTKELAKRLNIKDTIISPTFVLRKDYENLIHIDGYRFDQPAEAKALELDMEISQRGKVILIEWPNRFVDFYNLKPDILIEFKIESESEREIFIKIL